MNAPTFRLPLAGAAVVTLLVAGLTALPPLQGPAAAALDDHERLLVSRADAGTSSEPSISSDGQHVAFTSTEALSPDDTNGVADVYMATAEEGSDDPFSGMPELVSVNDGAGAADAASSEPAASADGRYIAFTSRATNLIAGGTTAGRSHVYVRDTVLGTTTLITGSGVEPDGDSFDADISDDGRWVIFTSRAGNLTAGDTDGSADVLVADRDADGDGAFTTLSLRSPTGDISTDQGDTAISGNGEWMLYRSTYVDPIGGRPAGGWLTRARVADFSSSSLLTRYTTASAIDATGDIVVAVARSACSVRGSQVVGLTYLNDEVYFGVGVATTDYVGEVGDITAVDVSADGSAVAWASTQPQPLPNVEPVALTAPVVRIATPSWSDAWQNEATNSILCSTTRSSDVDEVGQGSDPTLSVSGRTVALSASSPDLAPDAPSAVLAIDRHTNGGLAVSSPIGIADPPSFLTSFDTDDISASTIRDYGSALANAPIHKTPIHKTPIHKTPIHKTPIHKTPIHKTPIHKTPIHKTDIPGGWAELLMGTPFEGLSELTVTLGDVLDWAEQTVDDRGATPEQVAAARRILDLTLEDIDLEASGIGALTLGSLVLASAPLGEVLLGEDGDPVAAWQAVVKAQGIGFTVLPDTELAELDFAGVDISQTGVDEVPLTSLPIAATNLDVFDLGALLLDGTVLGQVALDELSDPGAIFDGPATGTIGEAVAAGRARPGVTAADLARVVPERVVLGDLLAALLDRASYPWEQIAPSSLNAANAASISSWECENITCNHVLRFRYTFDAGPGEDVGFPQAVAELMMPAGTSVAESVLRSGSGPSRADRRESSLVRGTDFSAIRSEARFPLGDMKSGTVVGIETGYTITSLPGAGRSTATLRVGDKSASDWVPYNLPLEAFDIQERNRVDGEWQSTGVAPTRLAEGLIYYEWISPLYKGLDDDGGKIEGPAADEDWYIVTPPKPDQRLVVSTNATDGQLALALYRDERDDADLGTPSGGSAPGTGTTEQAPGMAGDPSTSGTDAGQQVDGQVIIDQESMSGAGSASVEAASAESGAGDLLLRVTSGNGDPSAGLYALRVQYLDEPKGPMCPQWAAQPTGDPGVVGASDGLTDETNTIYVMDTQRFGDTWGAAQAAAVRSALATLNGVNGVHGAVLSVDASDAVRAARDILDVDPCSMAARADLTKEMNRYISQMLGSRSAQITSIVLVGGDDILPLAPVAEHIDRYGELGHAAELRRATQRDGSACPAALAADTVDPCATPVQAAAATSRILTDDPYGLATAYDTVGGTLYVPSVSTGRLVEDPGQIMSTIARFRASGGIVPAASTLTGGYGAWAELPDLVTDNLEWREGANTSLGASWDKTRVAETLFPTGSQTAGVVSINAHFDERALLPGIPNAAENVFTPDQLFTATSVTDTAAIASSIIFTIGCHAGSNLPASYYGADARDWVDVFSDAAGFVGNTGYGLASDTRTALSERLLGLYADWLGVTTDAGPLTTGASLVQAKRAYLAQLGVYGGYDEKVLMQSVYYGLPMYTPAATPSTKDAPLPEVPDDLLPAGAIEGGLLGASLRLQPRFTVVPGGEGTSLVIANGDEEALALVPGEPVLPKLTYQLDQAPAGTKARGALIRNLTSDFSSELSPAVTDLSAGVADLDDATRSDMAFPSTFAHITTQETPDGATDLLVVTPARVQARVGGAGTYETFTDLEIDVVYGNADDPDDIAPLVSSSEVRVRDGRRSLEVVADGTGSDVAAVIALLQAKGATDWTPYPLKKDNQGWYADIPGSDEFRWFLQVVDAAGNVGVDTARGHLDSWGAEPPDLGSAGPSAPLAVGERLVRSVEVRNAAADDRFSATYTIVGDDLSTVASGTAPVTPGDDGVTRATIDAVVSQPGVYTATLHVCRSGACSDASFSLTVAAPNHPPTASVTLISDTADVDTSSTLTARAETADEDGDDLTVTYRWLRNGLPIDGPRTDTLTLADYAQAGDTITVEVTADDGELTSGAARSSALVAATPELPDIAAAATNDLGVYEPGSWSRSPVTVTFTCTSGAPVTTCPTPQTVSADTAEGAVIVTGTMRDSLGREDTAAVSVLVDKTPPVLAPVVSPNPVAVGAEASATANATDAASGVAPDSATCSSPATTTPGDYTVSCTATDIAGNTATASAPYTVTAPLGRCDRGVDRRIMPPVNADGTSVFLRLSAIPVIFRVCDSQGKPIGTSGFVKSVTRVSAVTLPGSPRINELPYLLPTIKPVYIRHTGTWAGAIGSGTLASGKKYTYRVTLADGTSFTFAFGVR